MCAMQEAQEESARLQQLLSEERIPALKDDLKRITEAKHSAAQVLLPISSACQATHVCSDLCLSVCLSVCLSALVSFMHLADTEMQSRRRLMSTLMHAKAMYCVTQSAYFCSALQHVCVLTGIHFVEAYLLNPAIYSAHLKLHPLLVRVCVCVCV